MKLAQNVSVRRVDSIGHLNDFCPSLSKTDIFQGTKRDYFKKPLSCVKSEKISRFKGEEGDVLLDHWRSS